MQLSVIKTDGSTEQYVYTKVIGTFSNALAILNEPDLFAAEQFAETVTFYLYQKNNTAAITSAEIHMMILDVLRSTGYENAATSLDEHHLSRKLNRRRLEVIDNNQAPESICRWDKSRIVDDLIEEKKLSRQTARTIASAVEQKVLNMAMTRIRPSLIKQLVMADMETILRAEDQLLAIRAF